jgi:hypothetical protein
MKTDNILSNVFSIPDEYFTSPTGKPIKYFILQPLPQKALEKIGCDAKNILLSLETLKMNRFGHEELFRIKWRKGKKIYKIGRAKIVLNEALYNAQDIYCSNKSKTTYRMLVSLKDSQNNRLYNAVTNINLISPTDSSYMEIIDWYVLNDKKLKQAVKNKPIV